MAETTAGKLSSKVKSNPRVVESGESPLLVRDTIASHTTDLDGDEATLPDYLRRTGYTVTAAYEKVQRKIPFSFGGKNAYHLGVDVCTRLGDPTDQLTQIELEFIGAVPERPTIEQVYSEMGILASHVLAGNEDAISQTLDDKLSYFA